MPVAQLSWATFWGLEGCLESCWCIKMASVHIIADLVKVKEDGWMLHFSQAVNFKDWIERRIGGELFGTLIGDVCEDPRGEIDQGLDDPLFLDSV